MTDYVKYELCNIEPLRVADDSTSQHGQTTTLTYIPGSTMRGMVINALSKKQDFEEKKSEIFSSKLRFLNAYPCQKETELIPSPKGFYEDKTIVEGDEKKELQNILVENDSLDGKKRAALGRYAYLDNGCIYYQSVRTGADLKIKINDAKKDVFRNDYIKSGYSFVGYIAMEDLDENLEDQIKEIVSGQMILGNGRSAGMGKCLVKKMEKTNELPYQKYAVTEEQTGSCYMMLLSDTVMRNEQGEYTGLDLQRLEKIMDVSELKIEACATSTVETRGYNRTWRVKIPSVTMYEKGSVFRLSFRGTLSMNRMEQIMAKGIGVRTSEGFGRVLFLKDFEAIHCKAPIISDKEQDLDAESHSDDEKVLRIIARNYYQNKLQEAIDKYVVENPLKKGTASSSWLGILGTFTTAYQYEPETGIQKIQEYLAHAEEKESGNNTQQASSSIRKIKGYIEQEILGKRLEEILGLTEEFSDQIMGIERSSLQSEEEEQKWKLHLMDALIRFDNK